MMKQIYPLILSGVLQNVQIAKAIKVAKPSNDGLYEYLMVNPPSDFNDTLKTLKSGVRNIKNELMELFSLDKMKAHFLPLFPHSYVNNGQTDCIELCIRHQFENYNSKEKDTEWMGVFNIRFNDGISLELLKFDELYRRSFADAKRYSKEMSKILTKLEKAYKAYMKSVEQEYKSLLEAFLFANGFNLFLEENKENIERQLKYNKFLKAISKATKESPVIFGDKEVEKNPNYTNGVNCVIVESITNKKAFRHLWSCKNSGKYDYTINKKKSMNRSIDVLFNEVEHLIEV